MDVWVKLEPADEERGEELSHSYGRDPDSRGQSVEANIVHPEDETLTATERLQDVSENTPGVIIKTERMKIEVEIQEENLVIKQEPLDIEDDVLDFRDTPDVHCTVKEEPCGASEREEPSPALLVPQSLALTLRHHLDGRHKSNTPFKRSSHDAAPKQHTEDNPSASDPNTAELQQYICDACGIIYKHKRFLSRHVAIHLRRNSKKVYACNICKKVFHNGSALSRHQTVHTGVKKYSCESCNRQFSQRGHLKSHKITHTGERPYACDMCTKRFRRSGHLTIHKRTHTGETPFSCDHCARKFKDSGSLGSHRRVHFEKPHACGTCDKKFIDRRDLIRHERVHTGERPFVCKVCNKAYKQVAHLNIHTWTHAG